MWVPHACRTKPEESVKSSEICKELKNWKVNASPMEEQIVLLTTQPSLYTPFVMCVYVCVLLCV